MGPCRTLAPDCRNVRLRRGFQRLYKYFQSVMSCTVPFSQVATLASTWGIQIAGVTPATVMHAEETRLQAWQAAGYAGEMSYMERDSALFVTPERILPGAKSILSFAVRYDPGTHAEVCRPGSGRVARYARGRDYHRVLKRLVQKCMQEFEAGIEQGIQWRAFTDAVPLLERALARSAGLGFAGKNTMLIRPGEGSFFFLAEVLLDVEVEMPQLSPPRGSCGTCTRCLSACPTGAFVSPYQLDARRCISYLTIEKKGRFTPWEQAALGDWVFGCDVCQEVCPFNYTILKREARELLADFSPRGYLQDGCIDLEFLLSIRSEECFLAQFGGTPLMRPGREGLLRNACCVAGNTAATGLIPLLGEIVQNDPSAVLRETAVYALSKLRISCDTAAAREIAHILNIARFDSDTGVRNACLQCSQV